MQIIIIGAGKDLRDFSNQPPHCTDDKQKQGFVKEPCSWHNGGGGSARTRGRWADLQPGAFCSPWYKAGVSAQILAWSRQAVGMTEPGLIHALCAGGAKSSQRADTLQGSSCGSLLPCGNAYLVLQYLFPKTN